MSSKNYDRKCKICDEQYTNDLNAEYEWCKSCQTKYLGDSASGNEKIDDLIQEIQSKINDPNDIVFEWIPYDQFDGIEEISKGDIATVYSAIWNNGPLSYSYFKKELTRISEKKVALKCLHNNSQNNINELLSEIKTYSINNLNNILKIYGISQNLDTKNYIMVLHNEYFEKCCKKCGQLYTNIEFKWCNSCHVNYLNKNFTTHLSENKEIDNYIQEMQLKINNPRTIVFEWIPYNQFVEINEISKSGFTTVYFAKWKDGPLYYEYMVGWARELDKKVALKCLDNSQNLTSDFLNEVTTYSIDYFDNNFKIYGISQNPDTKDYIMVLQNEYCEKCVKCGKYVDAQHKWCKLCQMNHFKEDFMNWTSGNEVINGFIQEMQLKIDDLSDIIFEWIPFDQFYNVEQIVKNKVKDDVAAVYSAIWKDGPLIYSPIRKDLKRESDNKVAIKSYHNSKNNISEFLNEVKIYSTKYLNDILKIYGISQRPDTGDYMMVFPYKECEKCGNPNINDLKAKYEWCRLCQIKYFEENFTKWTSGNEKIDNLIQETQLKINDPSKIVFEWIPYDQLYKKGEISKSDFDMIYSAIWKDGPLCYYDREWIRKSDKKVALKYYHNIPVNTEFLNEVKAYLKMKFSFIINIYGISQDSDTKDYFIVLENVEGENFNDWMYKNYKNFNWSNKIRILFCIIQILKEIHQRQMVHRDFHTGNMLISTNNVDEFKVFISNMESCGEVGNIDTKVYRTMHYTAPEVSSEIPYTQAADIYSFGMIMYFIVTGNYPRDKIKPEMNEKEAPKCYIDLMGKCLDSNPDNRPIVSEIEESINLFNSCCDSKSDFKGDVAINKEQYYEIKKQFKEAEEYRKANLLLIKDIQLTTTVSDAIIPYIPLILEASSLITKIIKNYEKAECNKKVCFALAERAEITRVSMEVFKVKKKKNEKELRNELYYNAFYKFICVLEEIEKFTENVSRIRGLEKYVKTTYIKENFISLTEKYDNAMKDLHFDVIVDNEERRRDDDEALSDLGEFDKFLEAVGGTFYEELIKKHIDTKTFQTNKIDSRDLILPVQGKPNDTRGKYPNVVMRRILNGQEVACKSNSTTEEDTKVQRQLEILTKISECKHILRFYGVSKIDDINIWVFEWAHRGTLKELYETKDIQWHYKAQIALNICRGLIFLQKAEILHHDLRCENILMTESLEPKIYNFKLARYYSGNTTTLKEEDNEAVRWLAPEKLIGFKSRYTAQCEMFSFGILLWELAFEKIPYRSLKVDEIRDFVIKGGREIIKFGDSTPEISKLQEDYKRIISGAWKQDPQERISFLEALDMLDGLNDSLRHTFVSALIDKNASDLDGSKASDDDLVLSALDEGILAYRAGDHQKAWNYFEYHAANENIVAKFWKGHYLWEGLHDGIKEREEGRELLKEAADKGNSDAQLCYAFTFNKVLSEDDNINTFIDYLTKAAEGNNDIAQYNLGDIYYKGKLNIPKDENRGIKWLRKAALQNNNNAIKLLEASGIVIIE